MNSVVGAVWSLVTAAGAALAASAPFGAVGHGGQYLAGHVLLGLGLGQLFAALVRFAAGRVVLATASRTVPASLAVVLPAEAAAVRVVAPAPDRAAVTVLYPRPAAAIPVRGRHAA